MFLHLSLDKDLIEIVLGKRKSFCPGYNPLLIIGVGGGTTLLLILTKISSS